MRLFETHEQLAQQLGAVTKWDRALQALQADDIEDDVTYSIGDSLTYLRTQTSALSGAGLIGRRRYHLAVGAIGADARLQIAPKASLAATTTYSDLTDRQSFAGPTRTVTIPAGGVLLVDIDEAAQIAPQPDVQVMALHVTVEGATFHNK